MSFTRHALIRMQQRGIRAQVVEDLLDFGRAAHDHRGAEIVFFDKAARKRMAQERGEAVLRHLEKRLRTYLVLDADGDVLPVGHRATVRRCVGTTGLQDSPQWERPGRRPALRKLVEREKDPRHPGRDGGGRVASRSAPGAGDSHHRPAAQCLRCRT